MTAHDLVLGTAGHIDHGKTALVRALTGVDTDRLPAEKKRGITIDLGFASLDLGEIHLALIDVPGHERFIRNMLAGTSGLDLAMLIVATDDSVMPQTREHLEILRLLGLAGGLVVLTKCDLAEPSWLDLVEEDVRSLVRGTFLHDAPIVRTSAVTGQGLGELKDALRLLCSHVTPHDDLGLFRMAIDRSFTVAGHGTVVTGTVASGSVTVGDELEWQPAGRVVRVRGLHRHDRPVERIGRGSRAAINLAGVHHTLVHRGQELAAPGFLQPERVLSVEVTGSEQAVRPLRHRGLQAASGDSRGIGRPGTARIERAPSRCAPARPDLRRRAGGGGPRSALRAPRPEPAGDLGRRAGSLPRAAPIRRRDQTAIARLGRLASDDTLEGLRAALAFLGLDPWVERRLCALAGLPVGEVEKALAVLAASGPWSSCRSRPGALFDSCPNRPPSSKTGPCALGRLHAAHPRHSMIPAPARGGAPRSGWRWLDVRPDRTTQGTGESRRPGTRRCACRARAQAEPGRTKAQKRAV